MSWLWIVLGAVALSVVAGASALVRVAAPTLVREIRCPSQHIGVADNSPVGAP